MTMGVDVVESKLAHVSAEAGTEENPLVTNEPIIFGSFGIDEANNKEMNKLPENNFPTDAVDEWPEPKMVHFSYMVKYRMYEDQKLKVRLDHAEKELKRLKSVRYQINEKLRAARMDRDQVKNKLKPLYDEANQFNEILGVKIKEREHLQQALSYFRSSNNGTKDKTFICSSEQQLNDLIKSLGYRIQHESIPLHEEKQILREIKLLEGTRDQVIANDAVKAKIRDLMGDKETLQHQVKLIGADMDGIRKEKQVVLAKIDHLKAEKVKRESAIKDVEKELGNVMKKIDSALKQVQEVRKQIDEGNAPFYQNRKLLFEAKGLAAKKDVDGLKVFVDSEVDKFISQWSSNKELKNDYGRRILPSLDMRQLGRDGQMRNRDEKPLVVHEPTPAAEMVAKPISKQIKEDSNTSAINKEKTPKQQKEVSNKINGPECAVGESDFKGEDEKILAKKLEKDPPKRVEEAKLKDLKREEEMAKAKQALERKKKLTEKAAVKAQKEAEKKLKELEKKAKKKASASTSAVPEEPTEPAAEVAEPEKTDETVQEVKPTRKDRKANPVRRVRAKGPDPLPKIILKRKESSKYWMWAAAAVALLVVMLSLTVYTYLQ